MKTRIYVAPAVKGLTIESTDSVRFMYAKTYPSSQETIRPMLGQRRRRWASIESTSGEWQVLAGEYLYHYHDYNLMTKSDV